MDAEMIGRLHGALPQVRAWIDQYLSTHATRARAISEFGFGRLALHFPIEFLARSKVVMVDRVPFPPVQDFGLPEFAGMQSMQFDGITFKDTIFVRSGHDQGLWFHELVHVVQWLRLGVDNFLLAYGAGLAQFGYRESPLEEMAYSLQGLFELGRPIPTPLISFIEQRTDELWVRVAPLVQTS